MRTTRTVLVLVCVFLAGSRITTAAAVSGELKAWHKVTLTFRGPTTNEKATPNPFTDYRLDVLFATDDVTYVVPGYYAADGDAANSGAESGSVWRAHFAPDRPGRWRYVASFRTGSDVAMSPESDAGRSAGHFDGAEGAFRVGPTDKKGRDFRAHGRLCYVGRHHLRFAGSGEYFIKGGADAPENLLAYRDFDGDFKSDGQKDKFVKTWAAHVRDWRPGDPQWRGGRGRGLIGALNYLAGTGCNAVSFLTMNIKGDDRNCFPYISYDERLRMDCSRLDQWELCFAHADRLGLYLHFKTQETENDQLLDGGDLGPQRRLYYRELISRFGHHLALNWNLGEENTNTTSQLKQFTKYFHDTDPYHHNVVLHTFPGKQERVYRPLLGNRSELTGLSIQIGWNRVHAETRQWVLESARAGKPWVVANDEQGSANAGVKPDKDDPGHHGIRKETLWGNLMAGGAGVEYYFGYKYAHSDLTCQDWRSRDQMWKQTAHALSFFREHVPFWESVPADELTSNARDYCLAKPGCVYVVYLREGGTTEIDLGRVAAPYTIGWFDPQNGGDLRRGSVARVSGPGRQSIGRPPADASRDWVALVKLAESVPLHALSVDGGTGAGSYPAGARVPLHAAPRRDGTYFDAWTGTDVADRSASSTWIVMPSGNVDVTATYSATAKRPEPAPAGAGGPLAVTSFALLDAGTGLTVPGYADVRDGAVIDVAKLRGRGVTIKANTNPAEVGSVRFDYDGTTSYHTENSAPYAIAGDSGGEYNAWELRRGAHTLVATPYDESNCGGAAGRALRIRFEVVNGN